MIDVCTIGKFTTIEKYKALDILTDIEIQVERAEVAMFEIISSYFVKPEPDTFALKVDYERYQIFACIVHDYIVGARELIVTAKKAVKA